MNRRSSGLSTASGSVDLADAGGSPSIRVAGRTRRKAGGAVGRVGLRVLGGVFVLWAAATLTFFGLRLIPGDPAQAILGGPGSQASAEALAAVRAEYGLDQSIWVQYVRYLGRLVSGDLGSSYSLRMPVAEVIGAQIGGTLLLAALSLTVAWVIALGLASWSTRGGRVAGAVGSGPRDRRGGCAALLARDRAGTRVQHHPALAARGLDAGPGGTGAARSHAGPPARGLPRSGDARVGAGCALRTVRGLGAGARGERERRAVAPRASARSASGHRPLRLGVRLADLGGPSWWRRSSRGRDSAAPS